MSNFVRALLGSAPFNSHYESGRRPGRRCSRYECLSFGRLAKVPLYFICSIQFAVYRVRRSHGSLGRRYNRPAFTCDCGAMNTFPNASERKCLNHVRFPVGDRRDDGGPAERCVSATTAKAGDIYNSMIGNVRSENATLSCCSRHDSCGPNCARNSLIHHRRATHLKIECGKWHFRRFRSRSCGRLHAGAPINFPTKYLKPEKWQRQRRRAIPDVNQNCRC